MSGLLLLALLVAGGMGIPCVHHRSRAAGIIRERQADLAWAPWLVTQAAHSADPGLQPELRWAMDPPGAAVATGDARTIAEHALASARGGR